MSEKLYCPECSNYLMAGDGKCHDCHCGWKQFVPAEPEDDGLNDYRDRAEAMLSEVFGEYHVMVSEEADVDVDEESEGAWVEVRLWVRTADL